VKELKTFLCTEKTAEQAVLKVEVKTGVREDRDHLNNEVRISFLIGSFMILKYCIDHDDFCSVFSL
jgi:hypothetical protein